MEAEARGPVKNNATIGSFFENVLPGQPNDGESATDGDGGDVHGQGDFLDAAPLQPSQGYLLVDDIQCNARGTASSIYVEPIPSC